MEFKLENFIKMWNLFLDIKKSKSSRRLIYPLALSLILILQLLTSCSSPKPLLFMDFEDIEDLKTKELLTHPLIKWVSTNGVDSSKCIEVMYVGYEQGSKRVVKEFILEEPIREATLNYSIKFEKGFQFVKGGKLHGLGPVQKVTGGDPIRTNGWSARIMFNPNGKVASYLYHQKMSGTYGEGLHSTKPVFTPGRYNHVAIYVKLNNPYAAKNGKFELWVDGQKILAQDSIQFRGEPGDHTLINKVLFSTFHGGHMPEWAPKDKNGAYQNETAWFDDIYVYKGRYIRNNYKKNKN
mgnify:FL=1|tara:strand:- start:54280 stop:55164 length:885 start_codon:yes stop_codon:yes gene_type:complete